MNFVAVAMAHKVILPALPSSWARRIATSVSSSVMRCSRRDCYRQVLLIAFKVGQAESLRIEDFQESLRTAAMLNIRLSVGARSCQGKGRARR